MSSTVESKISPLIVYQYLQITKQHQRSDLTANRGGRSRRQFALLNHPVKIMPTKSISQPSVDGRLILIVGVIVLFTAAYLSGDRWRTPLDQAIAYLKNDSGDRNAHDDMGSHESHSDHSTALTDHDDHANHDGNDVDTNLDSIQLTPSAIKNIGLTTGVVSTSDFTKTVTVPGIVVERPGHSQITIAAPVTGVVTKVHVGERQWVTPGQPLFELRMTHEDVVTAQTDFLEHLHHAATAKRELDRLQAIGSDIIAGKRIIEQQYKYEEEFEKVHGLRQNLVMHGLTESQVAEIEDTREFLRTVTVAAPSADPLEAQSDHCYHVRNLKTSLGQVVQSGDPLASLANHGVLDVKGEAFQDDAARIFQAATSGLKFRVLPQVSTSTDEQALTLAIQSVADQVDVESRRISFYLSLPNEKIPARTSDQEFLGWKYRPGQRMEVFIPTGQTYHDHFVLPAEAVVVDGPDAFVFEQNGDYFDRIDVSVLHRDRDTVVVQRDGRLMGSVIAMTAAFEVHLALKNAANGPVDPHAGHTH